MQKSCKNTTLLILIELFCYFAILEYDTIIKFGQNRIIQNAKFKIFD